MVVTCQVESFMDDIEDEFFANLSQTTIDTAIEVCFLVCGVFGIFVFFQEGRKKIKVAAAGPATSTTTTTTTTTTRTTTNVLIKNDKNSGTNAPEEQKAPAKNHSLDDDEAQSVVAMELCDSVQRHFASMPMTDMVCCIFWNFMDFCVYLL